VAGNAPMLPSERALYDGRDDRAQSTAVMGGLASTTATPSSSRVDQRRQRRIGGAR
jgi:hypothetical protein